ncbi:MAG: hypothetical protein JRI23_34910, partial [Deltaproteobacteria bacterium]|nr:hypothetical protein [Deltaproteobacteria bacterium]MBW2537498.1 hypothetical protein [Deltaproteobacteria bacterium]
MTPNRAATVFRELLQTPDTELGQFSRRAGLHAQPDAQDLMLARELLQAVAAAIESNRRPDWDRVQSAWQGMRAKHAPAPATAAADVADGYVAEPAKPGWVRQEVVQKPSLGALAPGVEGAPEAGKGKFVPVARPRFVPNPGAGPTPPAAEAPAAPAPMTAAGPAHPAETPEWQPEFPAAPALLA